MPALPKQPQQYTLNLLFVPFNVRIYSNLVALSVVKTQTTFRCIN